MSAVQSRPYPKLAPVIEYVEIPDGSSSAQPVISPGPKSAKNISRRFCFGGVVTSLVSISGFALSSLTIEAEHLDIFMFAPLKEIRESPRGNLTKGDSIPAEAQCEVSSRK
jgi:hypothetical protein